jgi:uncharacterized protein YecT (DUF1311 family)
MPIDQTGDPWPKPTDGRRGESGRDPEATPPPATPPRHRPSPLVLLLGVAGALTLGVLFGLWARPELLVGSRPMASAVPPHTPSAPASAGRVPLVVAPPARTDPPPRAPDRLQTLPPEMAAAASAPPAPTPEIPQAAPPEPAAPTSPEAAEAAPPPRYPASFDCATARPGAEEMVCEDPALAAADRRMARAYRRAMGSGVDPDDLRQEQRDWTAIREDAAMHSRQALAQVYDQRIEELNRIADEAAPGPDD